MTSALLIFVLPVVLAYARRCTGGPAPKWYGIVVAVAVSDLSAWVAGHPWPIWCAVAILSALHFTFDHADDWGVPWKVLNVGRYSLAPLILMVGPAFAGDRVAVVACVLCGPLSAATYWLVQQPRFEAALLRHGKRPMHWPWADRNFFDGPLSVAEMAFGFWWGLCLALCL